MAAKSDHSARLIQKPSDYGLELPGFDPSTSDPEAKATGAAADDRYWTSTQVLEMRQAVARRFIVESAEGGEHQALRALLERLDSDRTATSGHARLEAFTSIVYALVKNHSLRELGPVEVGRLLEHAEVLLKVQEVNPQSSSLAGLYGEVAILDSHRMHMNGEGWRAIVTLQKALHLGKRNSPDAGAFQALAAAVSAMRQGFIKEAIQGLIVAEEGQLSPNMGDLARLSRIVALRLHDEPKNAENLVRESLAFSSLSMPARLQLEWEATLIEATRSKDFSPLFSLVRRGNSHYLPVYLIDAHLWALALGRHTDLAALPKLSTIRAAAGPFGVKKGVIADRLSLQVCLEECYDPDLPLRAKLEKLASRLDSVAATFDFERRMLINVTVARWASKFGQSYLSAMAGSEFRALNSLTSGRSDADPLGVGGSFDFDPWTKYLPKEVAVVPADVTPLTSWSRFTAASRASVAIGVAASKGLVESWTDKSATGRDPLYKSVGEALVRHASRMRGPMVKSLQHLSYLPIPEALKASLRQLQDQVPVIGTRDVKDVIERSLRRGVKDIFAEFDDPPFASGSIGQVHRAILHTGQVVAVKIRHPYVVQTIESDIRLLLLMAPIAKLFFPKIPFRRSVHRLRELLLAECDYRAEAQNQQWFAKTFAGDPEVVVPEVITFASSDEVLTSAFVAGQTFAEFKQTSTRTERSAAGRTIFRLALSSLTRFGVFNGDLQPGNFLFLPNSVAFVDFGFVKRLPRGGAAIARDLVSSLVNKNFESFQATLFAMGWFDPKDKPNLTGIFEGIVEAEADWLAADEVYTHTSEKFAESIQKTLGIGGPGKHAKLPEEWIGMERLSIGLRSILTELEASQNWHQLALAMLSGARDDSVAA